MPKLAARGGLKSGGECHDDVGEVLWMQSSSSQNIEVEDGQAAVEGERREGERVAGKGPDRRQSVVDRRSGLERRQQAREESGYTGPERRNGAERRVASATGLERRRGPGRRRSDERRQAEEGEMTAEQFEFCMAIQMYKKVNKKLYPTWTEVLEVIQQLGYRKVMPRDIQLENVPEPALTKVA
ncbi:MAG: hypothetical protein ACREIT_08870 [Tepidisphaeraceae bacterium]